jgi:translation initiation factor IF-2
MAKELNVSTKDLLTTFNDLGVPVKNHLAWVEDAEAEAAKKKLLEPKAAPAPAPEPEVKVAPAATATPVARPAAPTEPVGRPAGPGVGPRPMAPGPQRPDPTMAPRRPDPTMAPRRPEGAPGGPGGFGPRPAGPGGPRPMGPGGPRPGGPRPAGPGGPRPGGFGPRPGGPGPGATPLPGSERPARRPDHRPSGPGGAPRRDREAELEAIAQKKGGRKSKAQQREERRARREGAVEGPATAIELVGSLTVKELAEKMRIKETEIIKKLFLKGIMATINQTIEKETAEMIAVEMDVEVTLVDPLAVAMAAVNTVEDDEDLLQPRPPIVTIMGHVDHGKTSLLDALRKARVAEGEAGGITQHIGAYMTSIHGNEICFLDTPGHEAFTAMRARGAKATDIAILVVAADDGVMPQTIEAIQHAKAAGVPIIVAINKIDKPGAAPDRVKQELTEYELVPEEWGGQTIMVEVSAKQKLNLDSLLEMILLQAEVLELKANPDRLAHGVIVEAKLSKGMGPVATVLVQTGTLRVGDAFVVGSIAGRVRALINDRGKRVKEAGPAHPVEVLGLSDVPHAGDIFQAMDSEKEAKAIADQRGQIDRESKLASRRGGVTLQNFYTRIQEGQKELPVVIKADVKGSSEAIEQALSGLNERTEGVTIRVLLSGNGDVTENDVNLAAASGASVIAFNVKVDDRAARAADDQDVEVREYGIIYRMIEDLERAMKGMLEPEKETVLLGKAEVRAIFKVGKTGVIGGAYVTEGKLQRNADIKVLRDGEIIHTGKFDALKRFKDDVREVATGYECGVSFDKFNDLQEGDIVEAYITQDKPSK